MHLTGIQLGWIPPFTELITLRLDERVNVFIGPNASGKSTLLQVLAQLLNSPFDDSKRSLGDAVGHIVTVTDDEFSEFTEDEHTRGGLSTGVLATSMDWTGDLPVIHVGSVREGLPGISNQPDPKKFGETADEALDGPFSGSRAMLAFGLIDRELPPLPPGGIPYRGPFSPYAKRLEFNRSQALADACSQHVCDAVIRDSNSRNYIHGTGIDLHELANRSDIRSMELPILPLMGINTTDVRNFQDLEDEDSPALSAYPEGANSIPIYLGHLSSGTEGTLLWIRWLALKLAHHYGFEEGWQDQPAILLIDEIENHLHPTWQRRVIPALLDYFPGLQIFATTHSPFVVAGLKGGQVHVLNRDENGVVTASTEQRDVIGWTADEILRGMMGVDEPTDQLTVDRAKRLRELREKDGLTEKEEEELNQLRRLVNSDLLSKGGLLEEQRQRYADLVQDFLQMRQTELTQDGE